MQGPIEQPRPELEVQAHWLTMHQSHSLPLPLPLPLSLLLSHPLLSLSLVQRKKLENVWKTLTEGVSTPHPPPPRRSRSLEGRDHVQQLGPAVRGVRDAPAARWRFGRSHSSACLAHPAACGMRRACRRPLCGGSWPGLQCFYLCDEICSALTLNPKPPPR